MAGWRKHNTRKWGGHNGFTESAVVKLIEKKKGYVYTEAEIDAMTAYYNWRLGNAGDSVSVGTPDGYLRLSDISDNAVLKQGVEPNILCGSIECRPEKWIYQGGTR